MAGLNVLSGICRGGPKDGTTLATMHGRRAAHPDDPNGAYYHKPAEGTRPAEWHWVVEKKGESK